MALSLLPSAGSYLFTPLRAVHWGPGSISNLPSIIRTLVSAYDKNAKPNALIVTGKSLREKTPVISDVTKMLEKEGMFGGVFSDIGQHAREPIDLAAIQNLTVRLAIKQVKAAQKLAEENSVNVLVSIGGGSPIDSAKVSSGLREVVDNRLIRIYRLSHTLSMNLPVLTTSYPTLQCQQLSP